MGNHIGVAAQLVPRARNALSKSVLLGSFLTAYWPYIIYGTRTVLLHILMPRSDGFLPRSQRGSLDWVERPMKTGKKMDDGVWKRSEAVEDAILMLASQFFRHPLVLLGSSSLYTFDGDRSLDWNAVKQHQFTAPALLPCSLRSRKRSFSRCAQSSLQ